MITINAEIFEGTTYYSTEVRGVSYTISKNLWGDWEVWSQRQNMATGGQIKQYSSLEGLEKRVKALTGISQLIAA